MVSLKPRCSKSSAVLNKKNVGDLAFPACSGRRIGSMDLSQLMPGPGCVVADGNLGTLGRAVPGDVVDRTSNVFSKPEKVMRAQVQYAKRAAATGIQVPVTMAGARLAGMTFPRNVADTDALLRGTYGDGWNATCMICPHQYFCCSWTDCDAGAARIPPAAVKAAIAVIPACN